MYRLNIYAPIMLLDDGETYVFYEPAGVNNQNKTLKITFSQDAKRYLDILLNKGSLSEEELYRLFGKDNAIQLISNGVITESKIENDLSSRSRAFYEQYGFKDVAEKLSEKKILILGCGGIGTYVSWQMAAMGVKKIQLVDFDEIEASNLNRQILYTKEDIGKLKAEVLAERISQISYNTQIEYKIIKISNRDTLEKICMEDDYDLIIKALDSPTKFPLWLDQICKEHSLSYVTGLTFKNETMIGPSFVGGKSKVGLSDLIDFETLGNKVFGTVSSIGIALSYISSEISVEAFKMLTGEGELKYENKIEVSNFLTNDTRIITKNKCMDLRAFQFTYLKPAMNLLVMFLLSFLSFKNTWMFAVSFILSFFIPSITFKNKKTAFKFASFNSMVLQTMLFALNYNNIVQYLTSVNNVQRVFLMIVIFVILSFCSIISCLLANLIRRKK